MLFGGCLLNLSSSLLMLLGTILGIITLGILGQSLSSSRVLCQSNSLFCWLGLLDRLSTRSRIQKHTPTIPSECLFCRMNESRDRDHLFFECQFSLSANFLLRFGQMCIKKLGRLVQFPLIGARLCNGRVQL